MYEFIKLQYLIGRINADKVRSYAPKWITEEQAEEIITLKMEVEYVRAGSCTAARANKNSI
jgi:hypothetical protein